MAGPADNNALPTRPHLQLFNPDPSKACFHFFPQLPAELRHLIWNHALRRRRLIHVSLEEVDGDGGDDDDRPRYAISNALGRPITGNHYRVVVKTRGPLLPEIVRVNRESRAATMAFYAVKLPCYLDSTDSQKTNISLNLAWDYIRILAGPPWKLSFIDFIHDLRAYDPEGVGVRHLVIDESDAFEDEEMFPGREDDPASFDAAEIDATSLDAFRATVSNLESIWFMRVRPGGRALNVVTHTRIQAFNYGFPVLPAFTFFDAPARDPRDVSRDLKKVWGGVYDPRLEVVFWRRLLRKLGVDPASLDASTDVRIMVGSDLGAVVRSRADASRRLHEEDFQWLKSRGQNLGWESGGRENRPAGCFQTKTKPRWKLPGFDGPEVLAAAPRPALGFWLFPVEAFGEMGSDETPDTWLKFKGVYDMSRQWPNLALAHVS
ncbi:hypothetical protein CkaCkLH20_02986 [Colletotrichum karsti]|uniref:2EXR domain-containing protein n=1 Tax=Colletotrichum karsti TaxID=1095194 RepID=A0A9P6I936_9PEZI|nr:uncharacterized protein CkaCkLH20_02986 [Colletotrichum karsti]KAF9879443.1 hypothetical protein CkaCkLH20_02986 [Colletotrichum karsti]